MDQYFKISEISKLVSFDTKIAYNQILDECLQYKDSVITETERICLNSHLPRLNQIHTELKKKNQERYATFKYE